MLNNIMELMKNLKNTILFMLDSFLAEKNYLIPALKGWAIFNAPLKGQTAIARRFNGGQPIFIARNTSH